MNLQQNSHPASVYGRMAVLLRTGDRRQEGYCRRSEDLEIERKICASVPVAENECIISNYSSFMFGLRIKNILFDWEKTQAKQKNICYNVNGDFLQKRGDRCPLFD